MPDDFAMIGMISPALRRSSRHMHGVAFADSRGYHGFIDDTLLFLMPTLRNNSILEPDGLKYQAFA
jgi:hypothetical protein